MLVFLLTAVLSGIDDTSPGLRSVYIPDETSGHDQVVGIRYYPLHLSVVNASRAGLGSRVKHDCGVVVDVLLDDRTAPTQAPSSGTTRDIGDVSLDCYSEIEKVSSMADVLWLEDLKDVDDLALLGFIHPGPMSRVAVIFKLPEVDIPCHRFCAAVLKSCNMVIGNRTFVKTASQVVGADGASEMWRRGSVFVPAAPANACGRPMSPVEIVRTAIKAAVRATHVADPVGPVTNASAVVVAQQRAEDGRWHARTAYSKAELKDHEHRMVSRLISLRKGTGTAKDMSRLHGREGDIGEAAELTTLSCSELLALETSQLASAVSLTIGHRLKHETTFPSFLLRPLMVVLLAPISQEIEKKAGPYLSPVIAAVFLFILQVPLSCYAVGYLCYKMGYHLANVMIESLTYKTTDYIVTALEGTLARDISSVMMTAIAKWFIQTVVPEITTQVAELMPGVMTPGLSAAVSNAVVMAVTKPLTHALKGPVLAYYYCEYCYTYGTFCEFCHSDDMDAMDKAWWLDI